MKTFLLAAALTLGAAGGVAAQSASDSVPYDWAGFYGGVFAGYGSGQSTFTDIDGYNLAGEVFTLNPGGGLAGLTLGYNVQHDTVVFGLEGELGYLGLSGTVGQPDSPVDSFASVNGGLYGTLAARLGFTVDKALIYAKGGVALTSGQSAFDDICAIAPCGGATLSTTSGARLGYTVGLGVEYAFSGQWSAKLEYGYLVFGKNTMSGTASTASVFSYGHDLSAHTIKAGLNYKF